MLDCASLAFGQAERRVFLGLLRALSSTMKSGMCIAVKNLMRQGTTARLLRSWQRGGMAAGTSCAVLTEGTGPDR